MPDLTDLTDLVSLTLTPDNGLLTLTPDTGLAAPVGSSAKESSKVKSNEQK